MKNQDLPQGTPGHPKSYVLHGSCAQVDEFMLSFTSRLCAISEAISWSVLNNRAVLAIHDGGTGKELYRVVYIRGVRAGIFIGDLCIEKDGE